MDKKVAPLAQEDIDGLIFPFLQVLAFCSTMIGIHHTVFGIFPFRNMKLFNAGLEGFH